MCTIFPHLPLIRLHPASCAGHNRQISFRNQIQSVILVAWESGIHSEKQTLAVPEGEDPSTDNMYCT